MALPSENVTLPARGYRIDPTKALILAALCWLGVAALALAVHTGYGRDLDRAGLLLWRGADLQPAGAPWLLEIARDVTALGGVLLRNLFALMAVAALVLIRLRREAMLLALTVTSGWIVNSLLKLAVGRDRPDIVPHLMDAGGMSFPSGHSFNSAAVYVAIALAFAAFSARESVRMLIVGTAIFVSLSVAASRVWLGVHYPSDVIAGWLGGTGWAFLASAVLYRPAKELTDT